ncbi:MAG: site-specific integrase [Kiritimatiellae bacterium]|nr:site-specific integrase [Kiritimatiellia bacterium]MDD5519469.1 site-specific integrase [Kiritimatiellia bacterium]
MNENRIGKSDWELTPEKFLNPHELATLMNRAEELYVIGTTKKRKALVRDWLIINLAINTGLRRKEMCDLKVEDIRLGNGQSHLIVQHGKGDKKRIVHIGKGFKDVLKKYITWKHAHEELMEGCYLLRTERSEKYCVGGIWYRWKKYCSKRLHAARHTFGTYCYQATKNIRLVQKQMGHAKVSTTTLYSDCTPEVITQGMDDMERLTKSLQHGRKNIMPGIRNAA